MPLIRSLSLETGLAFLIIGGHSVSTALMKHDGKAAVLEALAVATCVVIFAALHWLVRLLTKGASEASPSREASTTKRTKVRYTAPNLKGRTTELH